MELPAIAPFLRFNDPRRHGVQKVTVVAPFSETIRKAQPPSRLPTFFGGLGGLRVRLIAGTGAGIFGQAVTAGIQLLSLPLFLHFWDTARYGKWVMLSAVPAYFAMSDGGLIPVAANKINMLHAGGDTKGANAVFQSALGLVLAAIALLGSLAGITLAFIGDEVLDAESRIALWLMIVNTLLSLFGGLFDAGFRAFGNYAQGVMYANGIRILEFLGFCIGLALGGTFITVALGALAGRFSASVALGLYCRRRFPSLRWGLLAASRRELVALLRPAAAYLAFPLGNSLSIQAITLIVGALFGSAAVAIFNTYRTLSRLALQMTATFSHALWTEFSRLYGAGDATTLRRVYRRGAFAGGAINIAFSVAMLILAPTLLQWWTHGKIGFDAPLFLLFAIVTLVGGLSHVPRVLLMSTNCHSRLGVLYLGLSVIGAVAAFLASKTLGQSGAVLAMIGVEAGILYFAISLTRRMLDEMPQGTKRVTVER
jgi:O-antigen/teichoic acid export membrane protein